MLAKPFRFRQFPETDGNGTNAAFMRSHSDVHIHRNAKKKTGTATIWPAQRPIGIFRICFECPSRCSFRSRFRFVLVCILSEDHLHDPGVRASGVGYLQNLRMREKIEGDIR